MKETKNLVLRPLLFVPGNQERRIEKARSVISDALILDLEDSVPLSEKAPARKMVADFISGFTSDGQEIFVRINSLQTPYAEADITAVVTRRLKGILLPKCETADDIHRADLEKALGVRVLPSGYSPRQFFHALKNWDRTRFILPAHSLAHSQLGYTLHMK